MKNVVSTHLIYTWLQKKDMGPQGGRKACAWHALEPGRCQYASGVDKPANLGPNRTRPV